MAEHMKLPWRMEPFSFSIYSDGAAKGPARVADMRGWGYLTGKGQGALGLSENEAMEIQRANAAFIVKAVNNHDALVAALREAESALRSCYQVADHPADGSTSQDMALSMVQGALALVGTGQQP